MTERFQQSRHKVPLPVQPVLQLPDPPAPAHLEAQRHMLQRFTARSQTAQRQAAAPVLRAASLDRQEQDRLTGERATLQRQISTLGQPAPSQQPAQPPVPVKPTTPTDWVTVMRHRAEGVEGQRLDTRAFGEFQTLQRQVAQTLAHSFRHDRGEASARYATYGEHLATLQRHALSAPVSRVVLGMVSPSERLPLQRAADEALQRQLAQEQAALNFGTLSSLQRQLAELDAEATQPVLQRIQARRGAGNPLPEAIQRHLEQGLNHDLSRVRIHDDAEADTLAKGVNATAFTTGTDIFFQAGRFNPNTQSGLELLAHEVTHTVQQSQGRVGTGIDPDAGLEQEARAMGARLASQPITRSANVREVNAVPVRKVGSSGKAVQRWRLGDLKKLAGSAGNRVTGVIKSVKKQAQQSVQRAANNVKKAAAAATKKVHATISKTGARIGTLTSTLRGKVKKAGQTVRQYASKTLTRVTHVAQKANQQRKAIGTHLAAKANQLRHNAAKAVQKVTKLASSSLQKTAAGVKQLGQRVQATVKELPARARAARDEYKAKAAAALTKAKARQQQLIQQAKEAGQKAEKAARASVARASRQLDEGRKKAAALAVQGWNTTVKGVKNVSAWATEKVNAVRNSPKFKKAVHFLKTSGVQIAKVGAAIVVGGAVIAGAAALTAATGGLAGPVLVGALFASGALGGAAGTVVENLLTGKQWGHDINAKSLITDGVLGVAVGPAAKLVGGVARAAGRPVLAGLGKAAARLPGSTYVQGLATAARTSTGILARNVRTAATTRWNTLKSGAQPVLSAVGTHVGSSLPGQAFRAVDSTFSTGIRGLAGLAASGARQGGVVVKGVSDAVRTRVASVTGRPGINNAIRAARQVTGNARDRVAVAGMQARNAAGRGWTNAKTRIGVLEQDARFELHGRGLAIDPTRSVSAHLFSAAERNLSAMRNYVSSEARVIGGEVRDTWLGTAGHGGVLRTAGKMEGLVARTPSLAAGWKQELAVARSGLVRERIRMLRLEARAAGSTLSRRAARRQARTQVTQDMVRDRAARTVRPDFLKRASDAYAAENQAARTGMDPSRGILAQLPRAYWTGAQQMVGDAWGRLSTLGNAGGVAGAGAVAGGWMSEEVFKTYLTGAAKAYKKDEQATYPNAQHLREGSQEVSNNLLKNAVSAGTGLTSEAQGGSLMMLTPFDKTVKTAAALGGYTSITDTKELTYEPPDQDTQTPEERAIP
ncbi:DUF4157 domain-containing protein [Deinococcus aquaticus]|uniref:DUF4157 domain-containing protein n=2 Tax=Deinococcus aquaticus TaxID=328692 RepID=A0ABY7V2S0_9DEIO|nr:DUF4157 domain-containing protein [Deinococcus aquaticus]WDA59472.1 DUF4157 domain-containing protein [Deinococcus aquaticus]